MTYPFSRSSVLATSSCRGHANLRAYDVRFGSWSRPRRWWSSAVAKPLASAPLDLAAILLTAYRHDINRDQEMPDAAFLLRAREICDRTGQRSS